MRLGLREESTEHISSWVVHDQSDEDGDWYHVAVVVLVLVSVGAGVLMLLLVLVLVLTGSKIAVDAPCLFTVSPDPKSRKLEQSTRITKKQGHKIPNSSTSPTPSLRLDSE